MKRIEYLDRARAFGMFLVYYAHFAEKLLRDGGVIAARDHWKFICAFLMQFFFFLAGAFWKPEPLSIGLFFEKLKTRLVPVIFFSALVIPFLMASSYRKFLKALGKGLYLQGMPLNLVTWFLVCLLTVELLAALIVKYFQISSPRLVIYSFASFCFGYYVLVSQNAMIFRSFGVNPGIWFVDDAFIIILFYFLGYISRAALAKLNEPAGWRWSLLLAPLSGLLILNSYRWNVQDGGVAIVLINASIYGNIWFFLLNSLIGIFALIMLSRLINIDSVFLNFIGRNSIIFLALNGISFHFMDLWVINHIGWLPATSLETLLFASAHVILTLILFSPIAWVIKRWLPEPAGLSWSPTSLLPPMQTWGESRVAVAIRAALQKYLLRADI